MIKSLHYFYPCEGEAKNKDDKYAINNNNLDSCINFQRDQRDLQTFQVSPSEF